MNSDDPKLKSILEQLVPFGFEFYGNDENGIPLVKGPNSQVVEINVAINFVNRQISAQESNAAGGSPEQMPSSEGIDVPKNIETAVENGIEQVGEVERSPENRQETSTEQVGESKTQTTAPKVSISKTSIKPYGEGFDPQLFDPTDLKSTLDFVEKNSRISHTSSNRWLAEQFKKFIAEFNAQKKK
jgi:hypothetical protein